MVFFCILAVLCVLYFIGLIIYCGFASKFVLFWLFLGAVFFALALNTKKHWFGALPVWFKRIFWTLFVIGICIFSVTELLIFSGCLSKGRNGLDYVIVLGAGVRPDGNPSKALKKRLDKAFDYYGENPDTIFVLSGGKGGDEPVSEAECMHDYMQEKGVPDKQLLMESESVNTNQNISYSKQSIPDGKSVGIISNNFHIFRAVRIAKKAGMADVTGIAAKGDIPTAPNNFVREFFGVMKDFLGGNM